MDLIDIKLLRLLERKPRASCSELASYLGISPPSVQRRIADLESSGRILGYTAYLSPFVTQANMTVVHGQAKRPLTQRMRNALKNHGSVRRIITGTMNHIYLVVMKKSTAELDGVISIFQDLCGADDPEVLIVGEHYYIDKKLETLFSSKVIPLEQHNLKKLDYQIILSLHENSRKSFTAISNELGVSARTVKRRLSKLEHEGLIEYEVLNFPRSVQDIMFILIVHLRSRAHRESFLEALSTKDNDLLDEVAFFDNSPRTFFVDGVAQTTEQFNNLIRQFNDMPEVDSVMGDIITDVVYLETYGDKMLRQRAVMKTSNTEVGRI